MTKVERNEVSNELRDKLRAKLRAKLGEKKIDRSSKYAKEAIIDDNLKKIGIDKDKFKADLEAVRKQGGLEINIKK